MLNTPNEWHNSENSNEEYVEDENYSYDEYSDDGYSDDGYSDEEYSDGEYSEEGYDDDSEEYEEDEGDDDGGSNGNGTKTKLIIGVAILLILSMIGFGAYGLMSKKQPTIANNQAMQTDTQGFNNESNEEGDAMGVDGEDVSIDVESDGDGSTAENGENGENENGDEEELFAFNQKSDNDEAGQNVDISDEETSLSLTTSGGKEKYEALKRRQRENKDVSVALGDVGRSDPFMPPDGEVFVQQEKTLEDIEGLDFEVIEPPELAPAQPGISRLLNTKVSGILYDDKKPSAIVNIDGADQLVRIGDVIDGFEFIDITRSKVVIKSDNNVYRASVGQPLNAEKIVNQIEISNLETKFLGSQR